MYSKELYSDTEDTIRKKIAVSKIRNRYKNDSQGKIQDYTKVNIRLMGQWKHVQDLRHSQNNMCFERTLYY